MESPLNRGSVLFGGVMCYVEVCLWFTKLAKTEFNADTSRTIGILWTPYLNGKGGTVIDDRTLSQSLDTIFSLLAMKMCKVARLALALEVYNARVDGCVLLTEVCSLSRSNIRKLYWHSWGKVGVDSGKFLKGRFVRDLGDVGCLPVCFRMSATLLDHTPPNPHDLNLHLYQAFSHAYAANVRESNPNIRDELSSQNLFAGKCWKKAWRLLLAASFPGEVWIQFEEL
jgi:hypothetical protein